MIYLLVGNNTKKKNLRVRELIGDGEVEFIPIEQVSKDMIMTYAGSVSLFGGSPVIVIEGLIGYKDITLSVDELREIEDSPTTFIFIEDKLVVINEKKYGKFAKIEKFEQREVKQAPKIDIFAIADAYERKDKIKTWTLYREAIEKGSEPEAISGMLFWKIKTMILNSSRSFKEEDLKKNASTLVSLHHRAHRGETDFIIGLEQFILNSLS